MNPSQEQDWIAAKNLLEENGYEGSFLSVAAAFIHGKPMETHESVSMEAALASFKEYFEGMGNTQRHIDSTFLRLNRFARLGERRNWIHEQREDKGMDIVCAPGQKGPWNNLKRSRVKPSERTKEKAALSIFFNYCVDKGWLESSPIVGIKVPKACGDEVSLPEIYTPEQAESLLQAAQLLDDQRSASSPPAVPFFVLGLFCGLRPRSGTA